MANEWSDAELVASIEAYAEMAKLDTAGRRFSKREVYRTLATRFGRTEKAFEYRMQNISAVLQEENQRWLSGLKPAANVGANVKTRIVRLLNGRIIDSRPPLGASISYKEKLPAMRDWLINVACQGLKVTYGEVMEAFDVDRFSLRHGMEYLGHQARNRGEPILTALIVSSKKSGRSSSGLAKVFGVEDDDAERRKLLEFWNRARPLSVQLPGHTQENLEVRAVRFASTEVRPDQAAFRRRVYAASGGRCVLSGCDVMTALDAAHRQGRDWRLGHNSAEDGYLLRKDLHALYDSDLLTISADGFVQLAPSVGSHYHQFLGVRTSAACVTPAST